MKKLSHARLKSVLSYNPETGCFSWLIAPNNRNKVGQTAGTVMERGYIRIRVDGGIYFAHHLAWFYVHKSWPNRIDHANLNCSDNRMSNLRLATPSQNGANRRRPKHNTSGLKGVCWHVTRKRWTSAVKYQGKTYNLGRFTTKEVAHAAYIKKVAELFGEFSRLE